MSFYALLGGFCITLGVLTGVWQVYSLLAGICIGKWYLYSEQLLLIFWDGAA
jgi:hypothetical protein